MACTAVKRAGKMAAGPKARPTPDPDGLAICHPGAFRADRGRKGGAGGGRYGAPPDAPTEGRRNRKRTGEQHRPMNSWGN